MQMQVRVELGPRGPVVVKAASGPAARLLERERARLRRAAHAGVVALVPGPGDAAPSAGEGTDPGASEVRTWYAGEPVARWAGPATAVAGLGLEVARTLADLHARGVVHGRLGADHILVDDRGRVRLCGFGPSSDGATPSDDVAALGAVLTDLLSRSQQPPRGPAHLGSGLAGLGPTLTALADRLTGRLPGPPAQAGTSSAASAAGRRRRPRHRGDGPRAHQALAAVLARATDPVPTRRPTARALADAITAAVPHAPEAAPPSSSPPSGALPHDTGEGDAERGDLSPCSRGPGTGPVAVPAPALPDRPGAGPPPSARRRAALAATSLVIGATAAGAATLGSGGSADVPRPGPPSASPRATVCPPTAAPAADVDGDGCPEALAIERGSGAPPTGPATVADATVITAGGVRWRVGEPGDLVAMGDWDCDGESSAALLRPTSGDVFVFDGWAAPARPLTVLAARRAAGATGIRAEPDDRGCDRLVVDLAGGGRQTIDIAR